MKRKALIPIFLVLALTLSVFVFASHSAPVISADAAKINYQKVACAKIENLLNLNNVFGADFTDNELLVNRAAINLKALADDEGFIPESAITAYIKDMYDIDLSITDDINADMPKKEGFVYLIPKGYTTYSHEIISETEQNGYLNVVSEVLITYHDGTQETATAKTVLIENPNCSFGYNILDCELDFGQTALNA
ncbi:MAG: hypothetical protein KBS52_02900 [Clostridiales bacterium]|nr:hypothetical protein [Candidatus Equinaster intestinalis]